MSYHLIFRFGFLLTLKSRHSLIGDMSSILFLCLFRCPLFYHLSFHSSICLLSSFLSFLINVFFNFFDFDLLFFNYQLQYYLHLCCHRFFLPVVVTIIVIDIHCQITLLLTFIVVDMSC